MSDALRKETANMELLEKEFSLLNLAESMPQIGEKFVKAVMEKDEPLVPKKDSKEENPWTEGDGGGCVIS